MKKELFNDIILEILDIYENSLISEKSKLWEEIEQRIDVLISTNTTYHHQIENVISVLEGNSSISEYDIDNFVGKLYKAHQFRDAKRDCAQAYLYQYYYEITQEIVIKLYSSFDKFLGIANNTFSPQSLFKLDDLQLTLSCDNGWAPHSMESSDGKTLYWTENQLDGANGISRNIYGFWMTINYDEKIGSIE